MTSEKKASFSQSSQYLIKSLVIYSAGATPGENYIDVQTNNNKQFGIDVRGLFQEINIYENMFYPCITGSILIHDGIGLNRKVRFDGTEYIFINVTKYNENDSSTDQHEIKGIFLIHKVTDRTNIGFNSEAYILHFISPEFLLSEQQKVRRSYNGLYSDMIKSILKDYLNVQTDVKTNGIVKNEVKKTLGKEKIVIPNLTPFKAIDFLASRSLNQKNVPDFLFWQNHLTGYNFKSLSEIFFKKPEFEINFGVKNINFGNKNSQFGKQYGEAGYYRTIFLGANSFKVLSNFDLIKNIKNGYYAGSFYAFDPLTRKYRRIKINHSQYFANNPLVKKANKHPFNSKIYNNQKKTADTMFDSKITVYPFEIDRQDNKYIKDKIGDEIGYLDATHNYILQRKMIFYNLTQRVIQINMPGNFGFITGNCVQLNVPHFYNERGNENEVGDPSLSGKYVITAVRHIIKTDRHETILEVSTDSSMMDPLTGVQTPTSDSQSSVDWNNPN